MNPRQPRSDALRSLSAIGAGVLLAVTPRCGGMSESSGDDSNNRGGAAGSAGYETSNGGTSGVGTGGTVSTGGTGGTCPIAYFMLCWEPAELLNCAPSDSGQAGAYAEAPPEPWAGEPDSGIYIREEATQPVPPPPDGFVCPNAPPFPECVMSDSPPPAPPSGFSPTGWNGTQCCYQFWIC